MMKKFKTNIRMIGWVFKYSTTFAIMSLLSIVINVIRTLVDLYILETVVDLVGKGSTFEEVLQFIIFIIIIKILLEIYQGVYGGYIRRRGRNVWEKNIQTVLYNKAMQIDISYFDDPELYDKFSRAIKQSDIKTIDSFVSLVQLGNSLCSSVALLVYIITVVPLLFILTLVSSIISFICYYRVNKIRFQLYKDVEVNEREKWYINRSFYLEKNAYDIKTTNIANLLLNRKNIVYKECEAKHVKAERKREKYLFGEDIVYQTVTNFVTYAYLMYLVFQGIVTVGKFTSLSASVYRFINVFYGISRNIANLNDKFQYVQDFMWLMDYNPNLEQKQIERKQFDFNVLTFENLSFKYTNKEEYALNNINLQINKGEKIAIIGYNGAGKTTLTKLLLKLYEPFEGNIYMNNINYNELSPFDIRNKASVILQNFQIYCATVLENVLMREKQTDEDEIIAINALKKVGLYEKIQSLPNGINTILTKEFNNDGIELSGGERQKLAIARVFASTCPIAILDEPTSALDPIAEKEINDDIIKMVDIKTIIIISHRLSTIVNVDKIYVMKDGKIEESGTHKELMKLRKIYYEMFTAQAQLYNDTLKNN